MMAAFTHCKENEVAFEVLQEEGSNPEEDVLFRGDLLISEMGNWESSIVEQLNLRLQDSKLEVDVDKYSQVVAKMHLEWNLQPPILKKDQSFKKKGPKFEEKSDLPIAQSSLTEIKGKKTETKTFEKNYDVLVKSQAIKKEKKFEYGEEDDLDPHDEQDVPSPKSSITNQINNNRKFMNFSQSGQRSATPNNLEGQGKKKNVMRKKDSEYLPEGSVAEQQSFKRKVVPQSMRNTIQGMPAQQNNFGQDPAIYYSMAGPNSGMNPQFQSQGGFKNPMLDFTTNQMLSQGQMMKNGQSVRNLNNIPGQPSMRNMDSAQLQSNLGQANQMSNLVGQPVAMGSMQRQNSFKSMNQLENNLQQSSRLNLAGIQNSANYMQSQNFGQAHPNDAMQYSSVNMGYYGNQPFHGNYQSLNPNVGQMGNLGLNQINQMGGMEHLGQVNQLGQIGDQMMLDQQAMLNQGYSGLQHQIGFKDGQFPPSRLQQGLGNQSDQMMSKSSGQTLETNASFANIHAANQSNMFTTAKQNSKENSEAVKNQETVDVEPADDDDSPYRARTMVKQGSKDPARHKIEVNTPPKSSVSIGHQESPVVQNTANKKATAANRADNTVQPTPKAEELLKRGSKVGMATNKGFVKFHQTETEETVDLMGCDLGDEGIAALYSKIKNNTTIKTLKLMKNKITDDGASILFRALCFNKTIQSIYLNINLISDKCIPKLIQMAKQNSTLKFIYLNQCKINKRDARGIVNELKEMGISLIL